MKKKKKKKKKKKTQIKIKKKKIIIITMMMIIQKSLQMHMKNFSSEIFHIKPPKNLSQIIQVNMVTLKWLKFVLKKEQIVHVDLDFVNFMKKNLQLNV